MTHRPSAVPRIATCVSLLVGGGTIAACGETPYQELANAKVKIEAVKKNAPAAGQITVRGSVGSGFDGTLAVRVRLRAAGSSKSQDFTNARLPADGTRWSTTFTIPDGWREAQVIAVQATGSSKTAVGTDEVRP
jgi:hypothetical protein